jgi:F0F1-type ATP synthase assembly protein I
MLSTAGLTLALSVGVGIVIGILLDKHFKTHWWTIVFAILGTVAGFQQLFRIVARANADEERRDLAKRRRQDEEVNR